MLIPSGTTTAILDAWDADPPGPGQLTLVLLGEAAPADIPTLMAGLSSRGALYMGAIMPAVVARNRHTATGALLRYLPVSATPVLLRKSKDGEYAFPAGTGAEKRGGTALILIDGLSGAVPEMLAACQNRYGQQFHFIGGGAGSITFDRRPAVFCNAGWYADAAVVALIPRRCACGVRHGWTRINTPLVATRTRGNTILELNWEPAQAVYGRIIGKDCESPRSPEAFFAIAKGYPFGLYAGGGEDIVRDPIAVTGEGGIVCVGDVPENALLHILKGSPESLLAAAATASDDVAGAVSGPVSDGIVIDCISRALYLGAAFERELGIVNERIGSRFSGCVFEGMLSLGEIASSGDGIVHFLNKTIVVGALYGDVPG